MSAPSILYGFLFLILRRFFSFSEEEEVEIVIFVFSCELGSFL